MTTELDELDEINLRPRPDKRSRNGIRGFATARANFQSKPKWMRQLRSSKGRSESQKLKAKVTT